MAGWLTGLFHEICTLAFGFKPMLRHPPPRCVALMPPRGFLALSNGDAATGTATATFVTFVTFVIAINPKWYSSLKRGPLFGSLPSEASQGTLGHLNAWLSSLSSSST